jgi:hypothetical protein
MLRTAWTLGKGALPAVAVASLIPLALFYVVLGAGSVVWAIGASILYAYAVALYQAIRRRRVSGMLMVTVFTATIKGVAAVVSGHMMVYFAVPVAETAGFGLMFLATMFSSEPLVIRLARDLVPHAADDIARRQTLTKRLSLIWTLTYLASGATTLALLTTVSLPVYLGAHTLAGWFWTGSGVALSIVLLQRRDEALLDARA